MKKIKIKERRVRQTDNPWFSRLIFLTVNIILVYLLFEAKVIIYFLIGLLIILVLWFTLRHIKERQNSSTRLSLGEIKIELTDQIRINQKYIFSNKRYLVITVIGLVLATMIMSQTVLISSSYKQNSFDDFIKNADTTALQYIIKGLNNKNDFNKWNASLQTGIPELIKKQGFELQNQKTRAEFTFPVISGNIFNNSNSNREIPIVLTTTRFSWTREVYNFLYQFPSFNKSMRFEETESIYVISKDDVFASRANTNRSFQILTDNNIKFDNDNSSFASVGLNVSQVWKVTLADITYLIKSQVFWGALNQKYATILNGGGSEGTDANMFEEGHQDEGDQSQGSSTLLVKTKQAWQIHDSIQMNLPSNVQYKYLDSTIVITEVNIKLPSLSDRNIDQMKSDLQQLVSTAKSWAYGSAVINHYEIDTGSPLKSSIESYQLFVGSFGIMLFLTSGILVGMALFLVYFSLTLVEQRKARIIAILKVRGSSIIQVRSVLYAEAFVGAFIAIIVGMILSIPWTSLSLRTSGVLQFAAPSIPLFIPATWYWKMPLIGLILTFDINVFSIRSLSTTTIEEGEMGEEHRQPFWQKFNLDLILFLLSVCFWFGIRFIPINNESAYNLVVEAIGPVMLFIMIIGAPLLFSRYFADTIWRFSNFLWRYQGGLFALATRNMKNNKFSVSRLASLLLVGIMLTTTTLIVDSTLGSWGPETAHYDLGTDIFIQGLDPLNVTQMQGLNTVGIEGFTEITKLTIQGGPYGQYNLLGIDSKNFADVAFWKSTYSVKSLSVITSQMSTNNSIGIQSKTLEALGLKINDKLSIFINSIGGQQRYVLNISTEFEYFPNLVDTIPTVDKHGNYHPQNLPILVHNDLVKEMGKINGGLINGFYVKVASNYKVESVAAKLKDIYSNDNTIHIRSLMDAQDSVIGTTEAKVLISSIQGMFAVTLLTTIIGISFYSYITLAERRREFGVLRAIGMVKKQISSMLLFESFILLFTVLIVGIILGVFISSNLFIIITLIILGTNQGGTVPPLYLNNDWNILGSFIIVMAIVSIMAATIPAWIMSTQQTGNIMRTE